MHGRRLLFVLQTAPSVMLIATCISMCSIAVGQSPNSNAADQLPGELTKLALRVVHDSEVLTVKELKTAISFAFRKDSNRKHVQQICGVIMLSLTRTPFPDRHKVGRQWASECLDVFSDDTRDPELRMLAVAIQVLRFDEPQGEAQLEVEWWDRLQTEPVALRLMFLGTLSLTVFPENEYGELREKRLVQWFAHADENQKNAVIECVSSAVKLRHCNPINGIGIYMAIIDADDTNREFTTSLLSEIQDWFYVLQMESKLGTLLQPRPGKVLKPK